MLPPENKATSPGNKALLRVHQPPLMIPSGGVGVGGLPLDSHDD